MCCEVVVVVVVSLVELDVVGVETEDEDELLVMGELVDDEVMGELLLDEVVLEEVGVPGLEEEEVPVSVPPPGGM